MAVSKSTKNHIGRLTSAVRGKRSRPEDALQKAVCQLLSVYERQGKLVWFAIPNGGKRSKIEAAIMKGLGVRAGVPDICIISNDRTIFFELKAPKGTVSPSQRGLIAALDKHGCTTFVIKDVSVVKGILQAVGAA